MEPLQKSLAPISNHPRRPFRNTPGCLRVERVKRDGIVWCSWYNYHHRGLLCTFIHAPMVVGSLNACRRKVAQTEVEASVIEIGL